MSGAVEGPGLKRSCREVETWPHEVSLQEALIIHIYERILN